MNFDTDRQTLADLSINGTYGHPSIVQLFKPLTYGGQATLQAIFERPLTDTTLINNRLDAIAFLEHINFGDAINKEELDFIDHYLKQGGRAKTLSNLRAVKTHLVNSVRPGNQQYIIKRGVKLLWELLNQVANSLNAHALQLPGLLSEYRLQLVQLIDKINLALKAPVTYTVTEVEQLDHFFRYACSNEVKINLSNIYTLDVFKTVATVAVASNFCYPNFIQDARPVLKLEGLFHPFIKNPVSNDIEFSGDKNICFITGANMAGKSTVLKSIGVCVFLAHLGFPVPARAMQTTVFNGLFTTINLSDNIMAGHSHFYSEVLRIKEVAFKVGTTKNILVIFDELFRGTNVKDAYDASLAIIKAFAGVKDSLFMISTHIVEVADELTAIDNMFFKCLRTSIVNNTATYTYLLSNGISAEKLGMRIIEDEKLVEIILNQIK